jgi:hypothetical protein
MQRELLREGEETGILKRKHRGMGAQAGLSHEDSRQDFLGLRAVWRGGGDVGRVRGSSGLQAMNGIWACGWFRGCDEEGEGERREWDDGKRGARHR